MGFSKVGSRVPVLKRSPCVIKEQVGVSMLVAEPCLLVDWGQKGFEPTL
jgi:hypothetical protein